METQKKKHSQDERVLAGILALVLLVFAAVLFSSGNVLYGGVCALLFGALAGRAADLY
jgi:hypothetical protein